MKFLLRFLAALIVAVPGMAFAQSSVLQGGPATAGHVPIYLQSGNLGYLMDSGPASGGKLGQGVSEFLMQERGSGTTPYANAGSGPNGENMCDWDTPSGPTDPNGAHYICFSPNAQGGPLISVGSVGVAAPLPPSLLANGVKYPLIGGGGNTVAPTSPAPMSGDIACWNGGTYLKDCTSTASVFTFSNLTTLNGTALQSWTAQPVYANTWQTPNLASLTETASHIGQLHATLGISHISTGSGQNGPASDDSGLDLGCQKANFLTSAVEGQVGCITAFVVNGSKGDTAAFVGDVTKVDDPALAGYGVETYEAVSSLVAPVSGAVKTQARVNLSQGATGEQQVTGVTNDGGAIEVAVTSTATFSPTATIEIIGVRGTPEVNGTWSFTVLDSTHILLANSVFISGHVYTGGGVATNAVAGLVMDGTHIVANQGVSGPAILVNTQDLSGGSNPPSWGSAFRVATDIYPVYVTFDMTGDGQHFVMQPPGITEVDRNYAATFLSGPLRFGYDSGNDAAPDIYRVNSTFSTDYPGGGALTWNDVIGTSDVGIWNLYPNADVTLNLWQKTGASSKVLVAQFLPPSAGTPSTIYTGWYVAGSGANAGLQVGSASGGAPAGGSVNIHGQYLIDNVPIGGVSSVALTLPGIFSVNGSPITSSGTLAAALVTQTANTVFAGPNGGSPSPPSFRALVSADLPGGVTGTGAVVLTASPTITGTISGSPTIISPIIAGPTFTGTVAGTPAFSGALISFEGAISVATTAQMTTGLFSRLAGCSGIIEGTLAAVSDSNAATSGATVTGGGPYHVLAFCNGTNWVIP